MNVFEVAKFFLFKASRDDDGPDPITHLKLQKLCYYAQGLHLALYDKPLFPEEIQAWPHGPVCPELYHEYKAHGGGNILKNEAAVDFGRHDIAVGDYCFLENKFSSEQIKFVDDIYTAYSQFAPWRLREMVHEEEPWIEAWEQGNGSAISIDSLREFFKEYMQSDEK